jgi:hypothetical protein
MVAPARRPATGGEQLQGSRRRPTASIVPTELTADSVKASKRGGDARSCQMSSRRWSRPLFVNAPAVMKHASACVIRSLALVDS